MAKKYRLLKDLPWVKAGAIYTRESENHSYYNTNGAEHQKRLPISFMNNEDLFEEVKEETPAERITVSELGWSGLGSKGILFNCQISKAIPENQLPAIKQAIEAIVNDIEFHHIPGFQFSYINYQKPSEDSYDGERQDYPVQPHEDEITFDKLFANGFTKWNDHFTYMCFPPPIHGNVRIDKIAGEWIIYAPQAHGEDITLSKPKTMSDVLNYNKSKTDTPVSSGSGNREYYKDFNTVPFGLYEIFWKESIGGGSSLAAVGNNHSGWRWIAPTNWTAAGKENPTGLMHEHGKNIEKMVLLFPPDRHATPPNKTYTQEENKDTVIIGQAKEIVRLNEIIKDQVTIITSLKTRLEYNL